MLRDIYKHNPKVLVTSMPPLVLQQLLTTSSQKQIAGRKAVKPIANTKYIGMMGSDAALKMSHDKKKRSVFMQGIQIPKKYSENTIGGIMALPVKEFIVFVRQGDSIKVLNGKIGERPFRSFSPVKYKDISSTKIRKKIKKNQDPADLLNPKTLEIIKKNKLYK